MGQTSAQTSQPNKTWELVKKIIYFLGTAGVLAAIVAFALPIVIGPDNSIVLQLMKQETQAARAHDLNLVASIYTPGAVVTEVNCQSGNTSYFWAGTAQIQSRYANLPSFISLDHTDVQITWNPPYRWAQEAEATSNTIGVMLDSRGNKVNVASHDSWTFVNINGQWRIDRFTYHC